jgi:hypothetical protein
MLEMVQPDVRIAGLADELIRLRRHIDELELEFSEKSAEFKRSHYWDRQGVDSAIGWLRFNCHMTSTGAADRVRVGELSSLMAASRIAMRDGHIGFAHLTVMARTAAAVGEAFDEERLLDIACDNSAGMFHYKCLHYRHSVDALGFNREQEELAGQRSVRLTSAQDGCVLISGILDPVGGAAVRSALEPIAQPTGAGDHRKRDERMADALVELATGGRPATLQVTTSVETLKGLAGAPAGEMEFSMPLSFATVQRIACDCSVMRVILDGRSSVIDVGRSKRLVDGPLRKVLALRDKHCRWPGCERPASWCDAHHLVHWAHGGETNADNCVLLCRRHHRMVHEGGWQLIEVEDRLLAVAPATRFGLVRGPDG